MGTLRELYPAAKIVTAIAAGIVLLLTLLFFGIDLAVGRSFGAALADSLKFLSFLLWMQALMLAVLLPLMVLCHTFDRVSAKPQAQPLKSKAGISRSI